MQIWRREKFTSRWTKWLQGCIKLTINRVKWLRRKFWRRFYAFGSIQHNLRLLDTKSYCSNFLRLGTFDFFVATQYRWRKSKVKSGGEGNKYVNHWSADNYGCKVCQGRLMVDGHKWTAEKLGKKYDSCQINDWWWMVNAEC